MYDELVKRLRICATEAGACKACELNSDPSCTDHLMKQAADAIEELSRDLDSMNEANIALYGALPKWIPVTERLPEEDGRYLVSYPLFNGKAWMRVAYFSTNLYYVDRYAFPGKGDKRPGFYYSDDEYGDVELQDVTHWMPPPEPPKEETNDEP